MPVGIQGMRGTGQFGVDFRPTNYREMYTLLEPNGTAPLNAILSMMGSESTDDPKFNNFRDALPSRRITVNKVGGYDKDATGITVDASDDVMFCVAGTLLMNTRTEEIVRCTADATSTGITVQRQIGGGTATINDGDEFFVMGSAHKEGGSSPTPVSFDPTSHFNYTQIFKTAFSVTGTAQNTYFRTGNKEDEYSMKALKQHMEDIERGMWFGKRHIENGNSAEPTRYTGGILSTVSTVIDGSAEATPGLITEKAFDRYLMDTVFAYGSKQKVAFIGPKTAGHLQEIGKNRWQPTIVEGTYGITMTRYATFAGDLVTYLHPLFRQLPHMGNAMVVLDMADLKYRHMANRDTQIERDIQANDADGVKHQYMTECGLEMMQDLTHSVFLNWNAVSA